MKVYVVCIKKDDGNHDNPHEAITHYHWRENPEVADGKIYTRDAMVEFLGEGNTAFVTDGVNEVECYVRDNGNIKFLQTVADDYYTDNLLSLPECVHQS
jgi:hypothetical protein